MALPLYGFDTYVAVASVSGSHTAAKVMLSTTIPARTAIGGLDLSVAILDTNASPTLTLDIGDANDADRFVADSDAAQTGELLEYRPDTNADWYRYSTATALRITAGIGAATSANGDLSLVVYGYPSVDLSDLTRATLQTLGVLAEGETARFEDAALAQEGLREVHEMLRGKGIANRQDMAWPLAYVPAFAMRPYAVLAGNLLADTFGLSMQRAARLAQRAVEAEREIRRQTAKASLGGPVNMEPYREDPDHILDYGVLA